MLDHNFSIVYSHCLGKLYLKLQKFITYSYSVQIIHILLHLNPLKNGDKTHKKVRFNNNNNNNNK
jgi:hypothetical protein